LSLGLRRDELIGLRRQDIDFATFMPRVMRLSETINGCCLSLGDAKSTKAQRLSRITHVCVLALARQNGNQRIGREWRNANWKLIDLVFITNVGTQMQPEMVKAIIAASGVPDMRLHDLRHSCATLLLAEDFPQEDVGKVAAMANLLICLVPRGGLEPPRPCGLRILSPLRLPISPSGQLILKGLANPTLLSSWKRD
jgi:integrase